LDLVHKSRPIIDEVTVKAPAATTGTTDSLPPTLYRIDLLSDPRHFIGAIIIIILLLSITLLLILLLNRIGRLTSTVINPYETLAKASTTELRSTLLVNLLVLAIGRLSASAEKCSSQEEALKLKAEFLKDIDHTLVKELVATLPLSLDGPKTETPSVPTKAE